MNDILNANNSYDELITQIGSTYQNGRAVAYQATNPIIVETYWNIGKHIVEFEQGGKTKAEYGKSLINKLSNDLKLRYGRGFSRSNLI